MAKRCGVANVTSAVGEGSGAGASIGARDTGVTGAFD